VSFVWTTAAKDLKRHARDPVGLLFWVGLPLIVGTLLILIGGGDDGPRPQIRLLVADEDDSFLSNVLVGTLSQDAAGGFFRAESVDEATGREILSILRDLHREGRTLVVVTHSEEVASHAERVVGIRDGKVASDGHPAAA